MPRASSARFLFTLNEGQDVATGERLGLIRFGSRTDVYLPAEWSPLVVKGQRVIGGDGAHPHQDGIMLVPQFVNVGARLLAGDITPGCASGSQRGRIVRFGWRRRNLSVERHGRLQRDQRHASANILCEGFVQLLSFFFQEARCDLHSG